mmetsp:Transcript_15196/g.41167  ORF Transcript_15196/g.41167 Transcript_15196/m.41167 type:complete len:191 (+) Transcript_15196:2236-2808(+)
MSLFERETDITGEFEALSKLLYQHEKQVEGSVDPSSVSRPTPAAIGPKDLYNVKIAAPKAAKDPKAIWDESEVVDAVEDDIEDSRQIPEYEFRYKQAVESTDVFLGMSGKTESSTSCEDLVVRIMLPEVSSISELDLDVKSTFLKLSSVKYKLSIYLPNKVDEDKGKAKWDSKQHILSVTLPRIDNEFGQ